MGFLFYEYYDEIRLSNEPPQVEVRYAVKWIKNFIIFMVTI